MDVKGIAWVGHVYQKFEAMFLEVEENIYEDTVKYVENQVQTVGSSVKKFYSDVMEDLLPPSLMGAEKVETSDLPDDQDSNVVIRKKPSKSMEIRVRRPDAHTEKSTEKIKVIANLQNDEARATSSASLGSSVKKPFIDSYSRLVDESISKQLDMGFKGSLEKRRAKAEKSLEKLSVCSYRDQLDKTASPMGGTTDEIKNEKVSIADFPLGSSLSGILAKSAVNESEDMRLSSSVDSITEPDGVIDRSVAEEASPLNEADEVFVSHPGKSDFCGLHEIESDADGDPEMKKEESCVVVMKGDVLHFVAHKETKNRPYRKKIVDAFSSKKHLRRKQEYEHYAEWYGGDSFVGLKIWVKMIGSFSKMIE